MCQISRKHKPGSYIRLLVVDGGNIFPRSFIFYPKLHDVASQTILKFLIVAYVLTRTFGLPLFLYMGKVQRRTVICCYLETQGYIYGNQLVLSA